nr:3-hydroxybutyryl-CoA dehydrogenase [Cytophagales bacterium]
MKNISVIGSGTMGNGIAHVFAQHGYPVALLDVSQEKLDAAILTIDRNIARQVKKGMVREEEKPEILQRISTHKSLPEGLKEADLVIEAAFEDWEVKQALFREIDRYAPVKAILASNTSSISITKIAAVTARPQQVIGMHFMNPVPVMELVEVICGYATAQNVVQQVCELSRMIGKTPVEVTDYPGFVANRILMPMINEAIIALQEGVSGVSGIDSVMKLGMAHPMGPLQLADYIGLDVCLSILTILYEGFGNPKYAPSPLLVNMVKAGFLGVKSGEGFYTYSSNGKASGISERFKS